MKKIALIPAYEPDSNLLDLLKSLIDKKIFPIVVDDGSGKEYKGIFEEAKKYAYVICYEKNRGKGYALKTGLKYIKENFEGEYAVITMDSDGQHTSKDAEKLIKYLENNPKELVLGKRIRNKNTPFKSKIGNEITRFVYKISTGINIYDTQTGLRVFTNKLIDTMIEIPGNRYEYEMNVLLEAPNLNIKMKEIEIQTIYIDNNSKSHFHPIKDSIKIYNQIIKFSLSSLISFIMDYILYNLILIITHSINIANVSARLISAIINYTINRSMVFKSKANVPKSALKYAGLAITILAINTLMLNIFVKLIGMNAAFAKLITEVILFIFSWIIQKRIIFNKATNKKKISTNKVMKISLNNAN